MEEKKEEEAEGPLAEGEQQRIQILGWGLAVVDTDGGVWGGG